MNEDKPIAKSRPALDAFTPTMLEEKSAEISFAALNNEVLLNVAPSVIQLVTKTTIHLRHAG